MTLATEFMTAEQLWRLPKQDFRCELVRGELRTIAPAGFEHGTVIIRLNTLLANHVFKHKHGELTGAETGFILSRDPDTVRGADIAFVRAARIPKSGRPTKFWVGAPDLAVEVLSPDDRPKEVAQKVDDYLTAGAQLVWVVNPRRRTVIVHRPMSAAVTLKSTDALTGDEVIRGFRCKVAEIFG
jgi:Uma2 family endonuclease